MTVLKDHIHYYLFLNEERLDSLFSQIYGKFLIEWKDHKGKGKKTSGKLKIELGSLLAKFGIGKLSGDANAELDYRDFAETLNRFTPENKASLIMRFYDEKGLLRLLSLDELDKEKTEPENTILLISNFYIKKLGGKDFDDDNERKEFFSQFRKSIGKRNKDDTEYYGGTLVKNVNNFTIRVPFYFSSWTFSPLMAQLLTVISHGDDRILNRIDFSIWGSLSISDQFFIIDPIAIWH